MRPVTVTMWGMVRWKRLPRVVQCDVRAERLDSLGGNSEMVVDGGDNKGVAGVEGGVLEV